MFERFSREGRLKRLWTRALEAQDPQESGVLLREVREALVAEPDQHGHLWSEYLEAVLDPSRLAAMESDDLSAIEDAAEAFPEPQESWSRLVDARTVRGEERRARALLARICRAESTADDLREQCVRELGRRRAASDTDLQIYVDHIARVGKNKADPNAVGILEKVLSVDFESDAVRLARAEELACRLVDHDIDLPGTRRALGLHALLVSDTPKVTLAELRREVTARPDDPVVALAFASALLRAGQPSELNRLKIADSGQSEALAGLSLVAAALSWLDGQTAANPPVGAGTLDAAHLGRYAPDAVAEAIGRLALVEGDEMTAAAVLGPLAGRSPARPGLCYHAAWAAVLTEGDDALDAARRQATAWTGRWCVESLISDAGGTPDPSAEPPDDRMARVFRAKLAIAHDETARSLAWPVDGPSVPERMETLRTVMGQAVVAKDIHRLKQAQASPLFVRLPRADATVWRALIRLTEGNHDEGRKLLEQAAASGHPRARLLLGVELLTSGHPGEATPHLVAATRRRTDAKADVLRAALESGRGDLDAAIGRLEGADRTNRFVRASLADLYVRQAERMRSSGHRDHARVFREQARALLGPPDGRSGWAPGSDADLLARCLAFIERPDEEARTFAAMASTVFASLSGGRSHWLAWHCAIAGAVVGHDRALADLESLVEVLEDQDAMGAFDAATMAQLVAAGPAPMGNKAGRAPARSGTALLASAQRRGDLVNRLVSAAGDTEASRWSRISRTREARLRYTDGGPKARSQLEQLSRRDHQNHTLALVHAQRCLAERDPAGALAALQSATGDEEPAVTVLREVAALLNGAEAPAGAAPSLGLGDAPSLALGLKLVTAIRELTREDTDAGSAALLEALRADAVATEGVVNLARCLVPVIAKTPLGAKAPPALIGSLRQAALTAKPGTESIELARCAAALGEDDLAIGLWERALGAGGGDQTREDLIAFLCHKAVAARKQGDELGAIRILKQAAALGRAPSGAADQRSARVTSMRRR